MRTNYQFNAAFINLRFYMSYSSFQVELPHATFAFTMTVILGLLQLKYQGKDSKTPFESHPKTVAIAITSLLLYCFAYSIKLRCFSNRHHPTSARNVVHFCMLFTSSLCLAATASFLFPDSVRPVIFVLYFMSSAVELLCWAHQRFVRELRTSYEGRRRSQQIFMNILWYMTHYFTDQRQILPL